MWHNFSLISLPDYLLILILKSKYELQAGIKKIEPDPSKWKDNNYLKLRPEEAKNRRIFWGKPENFYAR